MLFSFRNNLLPRRSSGTLAQDKIGGSGWPLHFGKADGQLRLDTTIRKTLEIGLSGKWHALFGEHENQSITEWLAKVCRRISSYHEQRGIGVIGLCLTGARAQHRVSRWLRDPRMTAGMSSLICSFSRCVHRELNPERRGSLEI
jgi:hypothetical protein